MVVYSTVQAMISVIIKSMKVKKDDDNDNDDDDDDDDDGDDDGDDDDDDGYSCNKCQEPLEEACATRPTPPQNTKDAPTLIMMIATKS